MWGVCGVYVGCMWGVCWVYVGCVLGVCFTLLLLRFMGCMLYTAVTKIWGCMLYTAVTKICRVYALHCCC